jgi:hypothetical protein
MKIIKTKGKASKFDKNGNLVPCEYEDMEVVVESVGDMLEILGPYSKGASLFMVAPKQGELLQRVQIFDVRANDEGIEDTPSKIIGNTAHLYKPFVFTIGEVKSYSSEELLPIQKRREAGGRKLARLTWEDMKRIVEISDDIIEKTPMEELNNNGERWFYEEVLKRYKANENGVSV